MKKEIINKMSVKELGNLIRETKMVRSKIDNLADKILNDLDDYASVCVDDKSIYMFDQVKLYELTDALDLLDCFIDEIGNEIRDVYTNAVNEREGLPSKSTSKKALWLDAVQNEVSSILEIYDKQAVQNIEAKPEDSTPYEAFCARDPKTQQNALMETAMRIMDIYDDLMIAHKLNPDKTDAMEYLEKLQLFIDWAREYEYEYCDTTDYMDNFYIHTDEVFTKKIIEKFGSEE